MELTGTKVFSTLRIIQPNDALDCEIDTTLGAKIEPNFYALCFFDTLNGVVTGVDGGGVVTGIQAELYDTLGNLITTLGPTKLDWYETETAFASEATLTGSITVGTSVYLNKVDFYYVGNSNNTIRQTLIFSSTAPATSTRFSSTDTSVNKKGILIDSAKGNATFTAKLKFEIQKA